ncbi:(Fe-S)-binding protein [Desulfuromonas carbonis]|uniref:(Fe-S)-binding protein n=1 Tax=Desulfuromonas sp. DDH964 TaxID=1823759 RepID=UPI00078D03B4|nr:(Fe-S)-binding protein [Desulfuromonas sp. DDH964]AMV70851.1 electron transporter [Desulfuromonas sp. DDH964]
MNQTREIYWNVGHGVLIPMYLLALLALAVLGWGLWQRIRVYRQGEPLDRRDQLGARVTEMLTSAFGQLRVLRVAGAGTAHALFFWGFVLLTIGTTLIFIQADILDPLFDVRFLQGGFYLLFSLTLDIAGLVAIVMLLGLGVRRYLVRPAGLPSSGDNALMLVLLLVILVSGFVVEGLRMAATELGTPLAAWSPVGLVFANFFAGVETTSLQSLHRGLWWLHLLLALGFIALIPFSKLRHLLLTPANSLFRDRGPVGQLATLDLEDESSEHFGAAQLSDLSWKDLLDADACTYCKRCQDRCPAFATDKPLSPMKIVNQLQELAFAPAAATAAPGLVETIGRDELWACTTCRACQEICPATIEHVPKIVAMRRNLVLMEGEFPGEEVQKALEATEVNGNPLNMGYAGRGDWAEELGIKPLAEDPEVDLLYFVGCYASFDKRNIKVAKSFIRLCQAAGLRVGILGKEEKCCGEPMRKLGNEYLYQMMAAENIELIKGYGVKRIVTSCPHCFNTLAKDYRDLGLDLPVAHYTAFLAELLAQGKLPLKAAEFACTYHDSCYLGRYNDLFAAPRQLIAAAGGRLNEMEKSGRESFCCGAGGGRILAEEKLGSRISEKRAAMAAATGAPLLVSSCPFCLTMFEDGVKGAGFEESLAPKDLAELLAERI